IESILVLLLVPFLVFADAFQAVIGTEIDNADAGLQQLRDRLHARPVRQAAEGTLDAERLQPADVALLEQQIAAAKQRRMRIADAALLAAAGDGADGCVRMPQQQPN